MRHWALTAVILFCSALACAQSSTKHGLIAGVVQDPAGASIAGARVELLMARVAQQSTVTDQSGSFQFKSILLGNYQVQVTSAGFETTTVDVNLDSQPVPPLQITLPIASLQQETTVT